MMNRAARASVRSTTSKAKAKTPIVDAAALRQYYEMTSAQAANAMRIAFTAALAVAHDENSRGPVLAELEEAIAELSETIELMRDGDPAIVALIKAARIDLSTLDKTLTRARTVRAAFNGGQPSASEISALGEHARGDFKVEIQKAAAALDAEIDRLADAARGNASEVQALIDKTLSEIEEISLNIRLISLNASVEAARAGPAGRGFGVIASEIQSLAVRAQASVDSVRAQIKDI